MLLGFLGRYSTKVAEVAANLPHSLYGYNHSLSGVIQSDTFERLTVCRGCSSLYSFSECLTKVGSRTTVVHCAYKPFKKPCNELLMKEIVSSGGHRKFYPHSMFCFTSLISSLQALVLRTGFMQQCESTRKAFATTGLSDVYDGTIWKDFLMVDHSPFLSECNNYGLLLNVDWLQPYKHRIFSWCNVSSDIEPPTLNSLQTRECHSLWYHSWTM